MLLLTQRQLSNGSSEYIFVILSTIYWKHLLVLCNWNICFLFTSEDCQPPNKPLPINFSKYAAKLLLHNYSGKSFFFNSSFPLQFSMQLCWLKDCNSFHSSWKVFCRTQSGSVTGIRDLISCWSPSSGNISLTRICA